MTQQQAVDFLHDTGGRLAVQHGTFALMRLEFVVGQFLFPAFVVQDDQVFRRMLPFVEQRRQRAMSLARSWWYGSSGTPSTIPDDRDRARLIAC